jgi:hypothetical protein
MKRVYVPAILLLAAILRLIHLDKGISNDEGLLWSISSLPLRELVSSLARIDGYPPLTYLIAHFWRMAVPGEAGMRLYFALCGTATVAAAYCLAREYTRDLAASRLVALAAAISPLLIYTSQYLRSYADSGMWILLSVLLFLRLHGPQPGRRDLFAYGMCALAAMYTFYFSWIVIFWQGISALVSARKTPLRARRMAGLYALIGAGAIPLVPLILRQSQNLTATFFDWSQKGFTAGGLPLGAYSRSILSLLGADPGFLVFQNGVTTLFPKPLLWSAGISLAAVLILTCVRAYLALRRMHPAEDPRSWSLPLLLLLPLATAFAGGLFAGAPPNGKYFSSLHVLFLIGVAAAYPFPLRLTATGIFIAFSLSRYPEAIAPEIEIKRAETYVRLHTRPGECTVYTRDAGVILSSDGRRYLPPPAPQAAAMQERLQRCAGVWYFRIAGNDEIFGANELVRGMISGTGMRLTEKKTLRNVTLEHYERR